MSEDEEPCFTMPISAKCKICFTKFTRGTDIKGTAKHRDDSGVVEAHFKCTLCGAKLSFRNEIDGTIIVRGALIQDATSPRALFSKSASEFHSLRDYVETPASSPEPKSFSSGAKAGSRRLRSDRDLERADKAREKSRQLRRAFGAPKSARSSGSTNPNVAMVPGALSQPASQAPAVIISKRQRRDLPS